MTMGMCYHILPSLFGCFTRDAVGRVSESWLVQSLCCEVFYAEIVGMRLIVAMFISNITCFLCSHKKSGPGSFTY